MKVRSELSKISGVFKGIIHVDDTVLVHSSLGALGYIPEGPRGLIEELLDAIGPAGNLIMMSATTSFSKTGVFDINNTPSETGLLTETFRTMPGVLRSPVPMTSFLAYGPMAEKFTQKFNSYLEFNSPMVRLLESDGKIMLLGVDYNKCTMFHLSEERKQVDYNEYIKFPGKMMTQNGDIVECAQTYYVRKDLKTLKDVNWVGQNLEDMNLVKKTIFNNGVIRLFDAKTFDSYCNEVLAKNPNAFLKYH